MIDASHPEVPEVNSSAAPRASFDDELRVGKPLLRISAFDAFKFGFSGPGPLGLLIGVLLFFVPIVGGLVLFGWLAHAHRRLVRGESPAVPTFDLANAGDYLAAGLVAVIPQLAVAFLLTVPSVLFVSVAMGVGGAVFSATGSGWALVVVSALAFFGLAAFFLVSVVVIKAVQIRAELTGDLRVAFDVAGVRGLVRRQWKPMLFHSLVLFLLLLPAYMLGTLAFLIGAYVVMVATQFMLMHLRYQIYTQDIAAGGEELAVLAGTGAKI